jgi:hypothetical protein
MRRPLRRFAHQGRDGRKGFPPPSGVSFVFKNVEVNDRSTRDERGY